MGTSTFVGKETSYNFCQSDPLTLLKFNLWIIHDKQFSMLVNAITIPLPFPPNWNLIMIAEIMSTASNKW